MRWCLKLFVQGKDSNSHFGKCFQQSMTGYLHIFRSDVATGTSGRPIPEFQLTFASGRHSWARTFEEAELEEFLKSDLAVPATLAAGILDRVRVHGTATVPDIEIPEEETSALGLHRMLSDI